MKISVADEVIFAKRYENLQALESDYIDHEATLGRIVPNYHYDAWILALAIFVLNQAASEFRDWQKKKKEREVLRNHNELEERKHTELLEKLDETSKLPVEPRLHTDPTSSVEQADVGSEDRILALLQWAKDNNASLTITIETEAEKELKGKLDYFLAQEADKNLRSEPDMENPEKGAIES